MLEQTKERLNQMKLFGALATLDSRLNEGTQHGWGNADFLSAVMDDEYMYRQDRKTRRLVIAAKFRTEASFEKLDTTAKRNITRSQISDLKNLTFLKNPRNVLVLGPTGVGKTFLATAMGYHACRSGYSVQFIGMNMFIEQMAMSRIGGTYLNFRKRLVGVDLLIIDDLGIKPLTPESTQDLYDILEERFQQRPTIITSQLPLANWKEVITDDVAYEAIMDRLIHTDLKIELSGESYRRTLGGQK
jgi:DNA replication protein DnaC